MLKKFYKYVLCNDSYIIMLYHLNVKNLDYCLAASTLHARSTFKQILVQASISDEDFRQIKYILTHLISKYFVKFLVAIESVIIIAQRSSVLVV